MSKGRKIGGIVLIIIGTIFLVIGLAVGGLFAAMNSAMDGAVEEVENQLEEFRENNAIITVGEIVDIDDEGMSTIEYYCEVDGYWYETYLMVLSEEYRVGSQVTVYYKTYDPTEVMVPELYLAAMGAVGDTVPVVGIVVGVIFGAIGLIMLIIGIVMLVNGKKDQKWTDEIKARNAAMGIGGAQPMGYQPPPVGQPMNGYQQTPGSGPSGSYQQPPAGQPSDYVPNPYQPDNRNM